MSKAETYAANKALILAAKDRPCSDCGGEFPPECMDFDHVRGEKKFGVGSYGGRKLEVVLEEIQKCDIVCANCHRIRSHKTRLEQAWSKRSRPNRKGK